MSIADKLRELADFLDAESKDVAAAPPSEPAAEAEATSTGEATSAPPADEEVTATGEPPAAPPGTVSTPPVAAVVEPAVSGEPEADEAETGSSEAEVTATGDEPRAEPAAPEATATGEPEPGATPEPDYAAAAAALGVSEDELRAFTAQKGAGA